MQLLYPCNYVQTHTANVHVGVRAHINTLSDMDKHSTGSFQSPLFSNSPLEMRKNQNVWQLQLWIAHYRLLREHNSACWPLMGGLSERHH